MDKTLARKLEKLGRSIREGEHLIRRTSVEVALRWWEVGQLLNAEYGLGSIPAADKVLIKKALGVKDQGDFLLSTTRRYNRMCEDQTEALRVAQEYGGWRGVYAGYVRGRSSAEFREKYKQLVSDQTERARQNRQHAANIPDKTIEGPMQQFGLSRDQARDAVWVALESLTPKTLYDIWVRVRSPLAVDA